MNKHLMILVLAGLALGLAACGGEDATATPEPTVSPAMPTAEPAQAQPPAVAGDEIQNTVWQWVKVTNRATGDTTTVPNPENYTIVFNPDRTVSIQADCNMVGGSYTLGGNVFAIQLGPSTMAYCGEESLDQQYLELLGNVVAGGPDGAGGLAMETAGGEQRMEFQGGGPPAEAGADAGVAEDALLNGTYFIEDLGEFQLTDGAYENRYGDGATMVDTVGVESLAVGDLNGDGLDDGAVVLWWAAGGSGGFKYLAAVVDDGGTPRQAAITPIGDRVQINSLAIQEDQIVVDMITHGPDDPMCCPSQQVVNTYELQGDQLVQTSSEMVGADAVVLGAQLSIINVLWQWEETVTPVDTTTVDDPAKYTLELLPGGEYRFTADCNSGSGTYTFPDDSQISFEPGLMTMAECGPDSLSDQYLKDLGAATIYFLQDGELYFDMKFDSGTMRFGEALGIAPEQISLDTQGLPYAWQPVVVPGTPYDQSQPPGPKGLPEHIEILFGVTDPADREFGTPVMYIIPVDAYERLWETSGNDAVARVMDEIYQYTVVLPSPAPTGMPALPFEEYAGVNDLAVQVGRAVPANEPNETSATQDGYRFVGRWVQDANPVTNQWLRYVYQGFTNDGKYLVSFWWPVRNPDLPDHGADVPADEMQKVTDDAAGYLQAKAEELNAQPTSAWEPDLETLNNVVASLEIEDMPMSGLTDKVWWWMGSTAGSGSTEFTTVDDPSLYQVQYGSDEAQPSVGTIQYMADCNRGSMPYELNNGGMVGGMLAQPGPMTLAECEPESRYQEFAGGLKAAQDYRVRPNGKTMVLVMPADGPHLLFIDSGRIAPAAVAPEVMPTPAPEATVPPATPTPTPAPTAPPAAEISFTADRTSIQQGECTTVRWKVENVKSVHVYPQGEPYDQYPVTGEGNKEVCPQTTTTYELRAELQAGEVVLQQVTIQVQPQEPQDPLKNTSWQLSSMNVNQVPLPDTTITLAFVGDGTVGGNASCNTYNGSYSVSGNALTIGPLATTRMTCGEDVDTQEQVYLTALQSAATFEISGNQLIIRDAGGQEVLRFNKAG